MTLGILPLVSHALVSMPRSQTQHPSPPAAAQAGVERLDPVFARVLRLVDRASRTRPAQAVNQYVMAVWSRFLARQRHRATRLLLSSLDDRALADIGVRRGEVDIVLRDIERRKAHWYVYR